MADPVTQRLNYYTGQFLRAEDFALEQSYHVDRQRRHNRFFHTPGVADGLAVDVTIGQSEVVVTPGTAVDGQGREIVLATSRTVTTSDAHAGNEVFVLVSYQEETGETKGPGDTRWLEVPRIEFQEVSKAPPEESHIRLAKLTLGTDASVTAHDESFLPRRAGVSLRGEAELTRLLLQRVDEAKSRWPALYSGEPNRVDIEGGLSVTGAGSFGGDVAVADGGLSVQAGGMTHFKAGEGFSTRLPRGGWYRIAQLISEEHGKAVRANAVFKLFDTTSSGGHSSVTLRVGASYADRSRMAVTVLNNSGYGRDTFTKLRILTKETYDDQYVDVFVPRQSNVSFTLLENTHDVGWSPVEWAEAGDPPTGFTATEYDIGDRLFAVAGEKEHMAVLRDGRTHATLVQGDVVHIGDKWRLSGVGDAHGNDDWLRLFDTANSGYYGGLAASKLWAGGQLYARGDLFLSEDQQRIKGEVRDNRHTVAVRGHWDELEIRGRVVEWTGSNLHIGYERDHSGHAIFIGNKTGKVEVQTNLFGAATNSSSQRLRLFLGSATPTWTPYSDGMTAVIDTSAAGFTSTPTYFPTLVGGGSWVVTGVTSVYSASKAAFQIYLRQSDPTLSVNATYANNNGWTINWLGIGV